VRVLVLAHDRSAASFRVRWGSLAAGLAALGVELEAREIPARGRARFFEEARGADVVVLHRRLLRAGDFARLRAAARKLVYDFDDALLYRPRPPHRSCMRAVRFFRTVAGVDAVFAGNRLLAGYARLRAERVYVVPSTVDPERYRPAGAGPGFRVAWIGQDATMPHLELVREPLVAAGFTLRAICRTPPPSCEFVPWSEATEAEALASCHAGVMPLPEDPFARGKCGYKLLQYFAAGLPAVASPVGVNRALAAGGGALLARTTEAWVASLARLRDDPELRARLAARGRAFVARRYASPRLLPRLKVLLEHVAAS
jgi:glycosyltransferase involved in cell wall biosynthesis